MNLELLPMALIAITVLTILLIGASIFAVNYAIETIKQKANSLVINCSETPIVGSTEIKVFETTIYCQLSET